MSVNYVAKNDKQAQYEKDRHTEMLRHGVGQAMHAITNITILAHEGFWPDDKHLWVIVREDACKILSNIMQLKEKLETLIGPEKKEAEE
jgi:hypothetical protein